MATQDNMKTDLPFPLECCKLDRAARLLGCEETDLIHWWEIGTIRLCVKDPGFGTPFEWDEEAGNSLYVKDRVSIQPIILSRYAGLSLGRMGISWEMLTSAMNERQPVYMHGYWAVSTYVTTISRKNKKPINKIICFSPYDSTLDMMVSLDDENENPIFKGNKIKKKNLYIMRSELEVLFNSIKNKCYLPNKLNDDELAHRELEPEFFTNRKSVVSIHKQNTSPTGRAVSCAVDRESVFAAAINVKEIYPEQCTTIRDWVKTLEAKANDYWPDSAIPLGTIKIEGMLGAAKKNGSVHKKL